MTLREQPETVKSRAYLVYVEWGPNMSIPRHERLATEFPQVPEATRTQWLEEFSAISSEVGAISEEDAGRILDFGQFTARLRAKFAFMSDDAIQMSWTLANYYAWHDGYR